MKTCQWLLFGVACSVLAPSGIADSTKQNVLFILVDDLRAEVGVYGSTNVRTPNLDSFAEESVQFNAAFVEVPKCGPSRMSMLTSRSPSKSLYFYHSSATDELRNTKGALNIFQWFAKKGYTTYGTSKLFHFSRTNKRYIKRYNNQPIHLPGSCLSGEAITCAMDSDDLVDHRSVRFANATLDQVKGSTKPWFLAVGFRRPHIKYEYPSRFQGGAPTVSNPFPADIPQNMPKVAQRGRCIELYNSAELKDANSEYGKSSDLIEPAVALQLRNAYFRTVEWVDELIGMILARLKENDLEDNTLVVITSDHGFNLGEGGQWCKMSLREQVLRVPLFIKDPRSPSRFGVKVSEPVQLLDLFPTIADLAGVPLDPRTTTRYSIDGVSFQSLVDPQVPSSKETLAILDPLLEPVSGSYGVNEAAFSLVQRCDVPGCEDVQAKDFQTVGFTVRTSSYRYTEWRSWDSREMEGSWDASATAVELYDILADPNETDNLALDPSLEATKQSLATFLKYRFVECTKNGRGRRIRKSVLCSSRGDHCNFVKRRCVPKNVCLQIRSKCFSPNPLFECDYQRDTRSCSKDML